MDRRSITPNSPRSATSRRAPLDSNQRGEKPRQGREATHAVEFASLETMRSTSVYERTPPARSSSLPPPTPAARKTLPPPPDARAARSGGAHPRLPPPNSPNGSYTPAAPRHEPEAERPTPPRSRAEAYEKIASKEPDNREVLMRLLDIYRDDRRWREALATVDRLTALETIKSHRSRYHYAAAVLLRDELRRPDLSVARFEAALDDDPEHLKAFSALDEYYTERKQWPALERAYRKMISRSTTLTNPDLSRMLWCNLGEIYRTRLADLRSAAVAYEMATKIAPNDAKLHTILAELYERLALEDPEAYVDRIAQEYQSILVCDPGDPDSYRNLHGHFAALGDTDRAFGYCAALVAMRQANRQEQQYFDARRPRGYINPSHPLDSALIRRYLTHPDRDPQLSSLFTLLGRSLIAVLAMPASRIPALEGARRVEPGLERGHLLRSLSHVQRVLRCATPTVYVQPALRGVPQLYFLKTATGPTPIVVVSGELARDDDATRLTYAFCRALALLDPASVATVAVADDPHLLKKGLLAACYLADFAHEQTDERVITLANHLRQRLDPVRMSQMRQLVHRLMEGGNRSRELDVRRWIGATHLTAMRVALLACGDLNKAVLASAAETAASPERIDGKSALKELILYGINENYFEVRELLGLQVKR